MYLVLAAADYPFGYMYESVVRNATLLRARARTCKGSKSEAVDNLVWFVSIKPISSVLRFRVSSFEFGVSLVFSIYKVEYKGLLLLGAMFGNVRRR